MNKQELRERVLDIFQGCDGGFYCITIETDDFHDDIEYQLDEEALYKALGFDWEKLEEMKKLLSELDEAYKQLMRSERWLTRTTMGKKREKPKSEGTEEYDEYLEDKSKYDKIDKEYETLMEALGDEADKYRRYEDIDWTWWEETPAFQKLVDSFVEELENIIIDYNLENYTLS